ncbi:MAG: hypothetical protein QM528_03735 [Phycisphaerales bacterium]|nr:hypothetical protein [Phycisphaerales bacterium]
MRLQLKKDLLIIEKHLPYLFTLFFIALFATISGCTKKVDSTSSSSETPLVVSGEAGFLAVSNDDGNTWTTIKTNTNKNLNKITNVSVKGEYDRFIVVGDSGIIFISDDPNAMTWERAKVQTTGMLSLFSLRAVKFVNQLDGYILVWNGTTNLLLISQDGGMTWTDQMLTNPISTPLYAIDAYDTVLLMAGEGGVFSRLNLQQQTNTASNTLANATSRTTTGDIYTIIHVYSPTLQFVMSGSIRPANAGDSSYKWYDPLVGNNIFGISFYNGRYPNTIFQYVESDIYSDVYEPFPIVGDTVFLFAGTKGYWAFKEYNPSTAVPLITRINYPNMSNMDTIRSVYISYEEEDDGSLYFFAAGTNGLAMITKDMGKTVTRISPPGFSKTIFAINKGTEY